MADSKAFDELERLAETVPELRGYYARGTGGIDLEGVVNVLKARGMTSDEVAAQCRSWVTGEMTLRNPEMSKERADELYSDALRTAPHPQQ